MKTNRQKINPCLTRAFELAAQGLEQDAKDPQKQGLFAIDDVSRPPFCPHQNYFEQILSIFDRLEGDEQEKLLEVLKERVKVKEY